MNKTAGLDRLSTTNSPSVSALELARVSWPHQNWMSPGLRPVLLPLRSSDALRFAHHTTVCLHVSPNQRIAAYGNTLWVSASPDGYCVALSFNWARLEADQLAALDPLCISSNAYPIDEDGCPLPDDRRFFHLCSLVERLPWQSVVAEHIPCRLAVRKPSHESSAGR